jgi:hypothetical protein
MAAEQQNIAGHVGLSPKFTPETVKACSMTVIGRAEISSSQL